MRYSRRSSGKLPDSSARLSWEGRQKKVEADTEWQLRMLARVGPPQTPAVTLGGDTENATCSLIDTSSRNDDIARETHMDAIEPNARTRDIWSGVVDKIPRVTPNTGVKFRKNPQRKMLTTIEATG